MNAGRGYMTVLAYLFLVGLPHVAAKTELRGTRT